MRILSWNLLRDNGARPDDVARLVEKHRPDLVLMQEVVPAFEALPRLLGGTLRRHPLPGRGHGPAAWSAEPFEARPVLLPLATRLDLPTPGWRPVRRRAAQVIRWRGSRIGNVHLDHGQRANRRQLRALVDAEPGLDLVLGDFNMIGPPLLSGFRDVGPRTWTHRAWGLVPLRLDRCLVRDGGIVSRRALPRGRSDHRPILLDLPLPAPGAGVEPPPPS